MSITSFRVLQPPQSLINTLNQILTFARLRIVCEIKQIDRAVLGDGEAPKFSFIHLKEGRIGRLIPKTNMSCKDIAPT